MSTKPILYYFDLPGRAEVIRLAFIIGHIDFEDRLVSFEEWPTKYKPHAPAGQLPVLEIGKVKYCESNAITMYAAKRAGLIPEDPELLLRMVQAMAALDEVSPILALKDVPPEELQEYRKKQSEEVFQFFENYGKLIGRTQHEKGFIAGDKLSAADIAVYGYVRHSRHPLCGMPPTYLNNIPAIKKIIDLVEAIPEVRQYYKL